MKNRLIISLFLAFNATTSYAGRMTADTVYIIYYATIAGKTGHIGIAVDNQSIFYRESNDANGKTEQMDTIANGHLTYYDLWPAEDHFSATRTAEDVPATYFKLPVSSTEEITLNSLYDLGIPHKEYYPCDGILKISTSWAQDRALVRLLDSMMTANRRFNAQRFNCADFVREALERLLNVELNSKEFVISGWSTTPNKLYRSILLQLGNVKVIKDPGEKATGSFLRERIIYEMVIRPKPD